MARRKNGRNISGWLIVDKPAGPTSTAVVNKVKWALSANKAGHAGTLDPAATGLLAIALGEATKTVPLVTDALKAYSFIIRFGQATNTDDAEGEVTASSDARPTDAQITGALPSFEGDIMQVPPAFSAVKIDGERAYKRAREGDMPELSARPLFVDSLTLTGRPDANHAELEMVCAKGGYVRAIARDLGEMLGCHAHVVTLRRLWSGPFDLDGAVTLDRVEAEAKTEALDAAILPLEEALSDVPRVTVDAMAAGRLGNGNPAPVLTSEAEYGEEAWAAHQGRAIAIGVYRAGELHPTRVFNR